MPTLHPSSRRFVPSEIWPESSGLDVLECHIANQCYVSGRCSACDFCYCSSEYDKIELKPCSKCEICDSCGERTAHGDTTIIGIDGVCPLQSDGRPGFVAGCGTFFGIGSRHNKSIVYRVTIPATEIVQVQHAKFHAVADALKKTKTTMLQKRGFDKRLKRINEVVIKTDCGYIVKSLSDHIAKWRNNNYTNKHGLPVISQHFIKEVDSLCDDLADLGVQVRFWEVPA